MRFGASTALLGQATPPLMLEGIQTYRATVTVTSPTGYRAMLRQAGEFDLTSLRRCISAGETLPAAVFDAWAAATGIRLMDGIGSTEMLHMFIGCTADEARPGSTGRVVPGYRAIGRRRRRRRSAPRHHRATRRLGTDRLPLSRRSREPAALRATRLEPDRRRLHPGRRRLLLVPVAHRRHDRLVGLQHRRRRGGERAPHRALRRRVRGRRRGRRGARPDRQGLRRARRRGRALGRAGQDAAGLRQVADRAVQVPARDRVRGGAAADADRQGAALQAAPGRRRLRRRRPAPAGSRSTSRRDGPGRWATPTRSAPPAAPSSCRARSAGIRCRGRSRASASPGRSTRR